MKMKKLLSGVLTLLILITALSGCGKTDKVSDVEKRPVIKIGSDGYPPFIAMTANAFTEDKMKSKEAGMNEHVSKPIDLKQLIKVITVVVSEKEARK